MSNPNKDFLIKDFEQAYENLRATDNKRDIIVGFYITLVGAIGSVLFKNYSKLYLYHQEMLTLGLFLLWIVGFIIFGILLRYRWWHEQWRVLANKRRLEMTGEKSNIYLPEWAKEPEPSPLYSWGVEFRITFLHAVINSIVGALFIFNGRINFNCGSSFFNSLLLVFCLHLVGLMWWYWFEFTMEMEIESLVPKNERHKKKLYIFFIPISLFLSVIVAAILPDIIGKIVAFPILVGIVFFGTREAKIRDWFTTKTPPWLTKTENAILEWLKGGWKKQ